MLGPDPECGYKVYIGPQQYFVITDIGRGRYQWYAFLARPADSEASEEKPEGKSMYLQNLFTDWSPEIHDILQVPLDDPSSYPTRSHPDPILLTRPYTLHPTRSLPSAVLSRTPAPAWHYPPRSPHPELATPRTCR